MSCENAPTRSRRSGGGAWRNRCNRVGDVRESEDWDDLTEVFFFCWNGMDSCEGEVICRRGVSQLNMTMHFLMNQFSQSQTLASRKRNEVLPG